MWWRKMLLAEADNAYQDLHNNSSDHAKASSNNIANLLLKFVQNYNTSTFICSSAN